MHLIRQRQELCVSFQRQVWNKNDRLTIVYVAFYESCLAWKISFIDNLFMIFFKSIFQFIKPVSHNSPVYPGEQPESHLPVVLSHGASPKQWALQLYTQSDPNVPVGHSKKKRIYDIDRNLCCIILIIIEKTLHH